MKAKEESRKRPRLLALESGQMVVAFGRKTHIRESRSKRTSCVLDLLRLSCPWTTETPDDLRWQAAEYTGVRGRQRVCAGNSDLDYRGIGAMFQPQTHVRSPGHRSAGW